MKNALTTNDESAPDKRDSTPGTLPARQNTVTAAVLAALLESNSLTGMDSVFSMSTTRLAAVIYYLEQQYGWVIERRDFVAGTNDGRESWVVAYWLPQAVIAQAFDLVGARDWIDSVKVARVERRKEAGQRKADAAKKNAIRDQMRKQDPRQAGLWGRQ